MRRLAPLAVFVVLLLSAWRTAAQEPTPPPAPPPTPEPAPPPPAPATPTTTPTPTPTADPDPDRDPDRDRDRDRDRDPDPDPAPDPARTRTRTRTLPLPESPPPPPPESGFTVGLRLGLALPVGTLTSGAPLTDFYSVMIPIQLDAGYRLNRRLYLGAYFQVGIIATAGGSEACKETSSCSAYDLRFGADVEYRVKPESPLGPWVGAGLGYEVILASATYTAGGSGSTTIGGLEFLHVAGGLDFHVTPSLTAGPYLEASMGEFLTFSSSSPLLPNDSGNYPNPRPHEWVGLGVRGRFDLL